MNVSPLVSTVMFLWWLLVVLLFYVAFYTVAGYIHLLVKGHVMHLLVNDVA